MILTMHLGEFVADLSPNHLPNAASRFGFIGTTIAGRKEHRIRIVTDLLAPGEGAVRLTFGAREAAPPEAGGAEIPTGVLFKRLTHLQSLPVSERMAP